MDELNENDLQDCSLYSISQRNMSQSEDDSLTEGNLDPMDDDLMYNNVADEDEELGSSNEIDHLATSPGIRAFGSISAPKQVRDRAKDNSFPLEDYKLEATRSKSAEPGTSSSKRSSGRLRKEKVPIQRKTLFPGRPRIRGRKFANTLNQNLTDTSVPSYKSSTSVSADKTPEIAVKYIADKEHVAEVSLLASGNSTETTITAQCNVQSVPEQLAVTSQSVGATVPLRRKLNHPGKIKGKLSGRKKAKTMESRRKRSSKNSAHKLKTYSSSMITPTSTSTVRQQLEQTDSDSKGGEGEKMERKVILCSSKDYFVLTQDICCLCGSIGKGDDARLMACSQCGQCYHTFCAGVTKITKVMLEKGWRCLECIVCEICSQSHHETSLLLCDNCDISYHTYCLDPPLETVPEGDWKCQWCSICIKCKSTTPGINSQWQENYTLCGPCASEKKCSLCMVNYREDELIVQCSKCNRWLHGSCDLIPDEAQCELATTLGYICRNCRPLGEPPSHIQACKDGTIKSILAKLRYDEKTEDLGSNNKKKTDQSICKPLESTESTTSVVTSTPTTTAPIAGELSNGVTNNVNNGGNTTSPATKIASKFHLMDGIYLTDAGFSMMKSLTEQTKKTRMKRKNLKKDESEESQTNAEEHLEDRGNEQTEEEKKMRQRRLRLEKLGIGGFLAKAKGGRPSVIKDEDDTQDSFERCTTPDGKPKRRRRVNRKKSRLQDSFPSYLQEAFFGQKILDSVNSTQSTESTTKFLDNDNEEEEDRAFVNAIEKDKVVCLSSLELSNNQTTSQNLATRDDSAQDTANDRENEEDDLNFLDEELPPGEEFDDFPYGMLDMLNDLEPNEGKLDELVNADNDDDGKDLDLLDENFHFNDITGDEDIPQIDGKEVEDLFNDLSENSIRETKDFSVPTVSDANTTHLSMLAKPSASESMQLPNLLQSKACHSTSDLTTIGPSQTGQPSTSAGSTNTPITSVEHLEMLDGINQKASFESTNPNQSVVNQIAAPVSSKPMTENLPSSWQNNETEQANETQSQKNLIKWEGEEALGDLATISPVLYANICHPNLKSEYPVWSERVKHITKLWRQLNSDQRKPYLDKARENRAASRNQKNQSEPGKQSVCKDAKNDAEKQWKDAHSNQAHSNGATVMMGEPSGGQCPPEMAYPISTDYGPPSVASNHMYSPSSMPPQVKMQSPAPMMMNRPPPTPGSGTPLQSPMSPMVHSPRLRPGMQGPFGQAENYGQQPPHQLNMVRQGMVSQGSFSPTSPSLNATAAVHSMSSGECYQSSNPSTPQRPQSTDPQHSYGQVTSPYGGPPRTPSSMMNPFSPSHHPQMTPMHPSPMASDNFSMNNHQSSQSNLDQSANIDMYKVALTPQHLSKPHTPDSFVPSISSSLPSTPQPSSPQIPASSPVSDNYARSPATPRSASVSQPRPQFDEAFNQRSDLYTQSNTNPSGNYQQQYIQSSGSFVPDSAKVQMRPNLAGNIRPNVPIRRAVSDPYARQPMTPMPNESHHSFKPEETQDPNSKQQLRNLLQVQHMRRQEPNTPQPRPNWIDNGFRQPLSPAINRPRGPIPPGGNQFAIEQNFRFPTEQHRMMMQRSPEIRFRQMAPHANQQFNQQRFPSQPISQMQPQPVPPQQQQNQQWTRMPMQLTIQSSSQQSNSEMSPHMNSQSMNPMTPGQSNAYVPSSNYHQMKNEVDMNIEAKTESKSMDLVDSKLTSPNDLISSLAEDDNLPVDLGVDDDLELELGNDFNILEYGDPEAEKGLGGMAGKSNIFDEVDERDMLGEKDKDLDPKEKMQLERTGAFTQENLDSLASTSQNYLQNKLITPENEQTRVEQNYFSNLTNADCLLSDDEFERLKLDFLNDPVEPGGNLQPISCMSSPRTSHPQQASTSHGPSVPPQHMNMPPQQSAPLPPPPPPAPTPTPQSHSQPQVYHQTGAHFAHHVNPGQPMWQEPTPPQQQQQAPHFVKQTNFPNRMHLRMPMNQPAPVSRHISGPTQAPMFGPGPANRMLLQQSQVGNVGGGHMSMHGPPPPPSTTSMNTQVPHQGVNLPQPPLPPSDPQTDHDRQLLFQYHQWLIQQHKYLSNQQGFHETEVNKLRKLKKSLNAKQRQCRKNNTDLSEHDQNELARVIQEVSGLQKQLEQARKLLRNHKTLSNEFRQKYGHLIGLPHSPGAQTVQNSPRSVNSPMAALNTSGPGTPLGIGAPSTPQSPSLTSPSPSSLMQNSPIPTLHSPASLMPQSPIHHSPMPNTQDMVGSMRPQIVQEDNNPFSDVYLQKEKKQHLQQSTVYSHQVSTEMVESHQQMYATGGGNNYCEESSMQQYYHTQNYQASGQLRSQAQMSHYPTMAEPTSYRFNNPHGQMMPNSQYGGQQLAYQQIRRPPPPPYPSNAPQHFNPRGGYQASQIRNASIRPNQMQHSASHYAESPGMASTDGGFALGQQVVQTNMSHMPMTPLDSQSAINPIVGEAKTTMEFTITELGPGRDNESDPFTFLRERQNTKAPHSSGTHSGNNNVSVVHNNDGISTGFNQLEQHHADPISNLPVNQQSGGPSSTSSSGVAFSTHPHSSQEHTEVASLDAANKGDQDEINKAKQESTEAKNELLKQLLQNCPSADLNKLATSTEDNSQKEIKLERCDNDNQTGVSQKSAEQVKQEQPNPIESTVSNESAPAVNKESVTPTVIEKKLTYLDIRRAQLERDPTPPPEDYKPKRKRNKRKESKSLDQESVESGNSSHSVNMPKISKKRSRKGSQNRSEETGGITPTKENTHEQLFNSILAHLQTLPALKQMEPEFQPNFNLCLPPDAPNMNSPESKLRGCYGQGFLCSPIDYYSTFPFGPKKASSVVPPLPPTVVSNTSKSKNLFHEEFSRTIPDLNDLFKERSSIKAHYTLYARDMDSPETVISSSSPECVLYDQPEDVYNRMKYINDDSNDSDNQKDRLSPFIFMPLPVRPTPRYSPLKGHDLEETNDKENVYDGNKSNILKVISSEPLKENNNVNVTLMISTDKDVRNVLLSLARLLNLPSPVIYNIEKSPTGKMTETLELNREDIADCCKYCNKMLAHGHLSYKPEWLADYEENENSFCSKECCHNYRVTQRASEQTDLCLELQNETSESEIVSILSSEKSVSEAAAAAADLEEFKTLISSQEKRWKNIRYRYWNESSVDSQLRNQTLENLEQQQPQSTDSESIGHILDELAICLKPSKNYVDKRVCSFCHEMGDGELDGPSRLLNTDVDKWVHLNCALWSNEACECTNGAMLDFHKANTKAMNLCCVRCNKLGASLRCMRFRCTNAYHFSCAIKEQCKFYSDKGFYCLTHALKEHEMIRDDVKLSELISFVVNRRVYIDRDEPKQIAAMFHQGGNNLLRIGSLIFLSIGQLFPHQLQAFHNESYIYPIGYKISRYYWSCRRLGKRCQYICSISEEDGKPLFNVEVREDGYETLTYRARTPKLAWQQVIEQIRDLHEKSQTIKIFTDSIEGEDLFGLKEPVIVRILESLPGVDTLNDYNFQFGRSPWYELPLAINPTGCARTEPKKTHFKRSKHFNTLHVSSSSRFSSRALSQSSLTPPESPSPYVKQFVHSKTSLYRNMKKEWRQIVCLGHSRIQGLGLFAKRDIEKSSMIIEYVGVVIRSTLSDVFERTYEKQNRGIYMFRLDENRVIDATRSGGLARYINHSCNPNCVAECMQIDRQNKILIIASRHIKEGEELTYDYKFDLEDDQHKIPCHCKAKNCRKWMN